MTLCKIKATHRAMTAHGAQLACRRFGASALRFTGKRRVVGFLHLRIDDVATIVVGFMNMNLGVICLRLCQIEFVVLRRAMS